MIPSPSPLAALAHDLTEELAGISLSWEREYGVPTEADVRRHFRARCTDHEQIAALDTKPAQAAAWRCVAAVLDATEHILSEATCAGCGRSNAEMRAYVYESVMPHARAFWDKKYPGQWNDSLEAHYSFRAEPGWVLPDGTYYCHYCGLERVYQALIQGIYQPPSIPKGDPS